MKQIIEMKTTELRIPAGRRQTSWLFTRNDQGVEPGSYPEQHQLVARAGFECRVTTLKSSALDHLAILPPHDSGIQSGLPIGLTCCAVLDQTAQN